MKKTLALFFTLLSICICFSATHVALAYDACHFYNCGTFSYTAPNGTVFGVSVTSTDAPGWQVCPNTAAYACSLAVSDLQTKLAAQQIALYDNYNGGWTEACGNIATFYSWITGQPATCGSSNLTVTAALPVGSAACSVGNQVSTSEATSSFSWSCTGTASGSVTNADCASYKPPTCGSSNGGAFQSTPPNLCAVGTPGSVLTGGRTDLWSWPCYNGGSTASCMAGHLASCGNTTAIPSSLCSGGSVSSVPYVDVDKVAHTYSWTCSGINSSNASCSVPGVSACGTKNGNTIPSGRYPGTISNSFCYSTKDILSPTYTVDYNTGVWSWWCQNETLPAKATCSATCAAGTYICKNTSVCSSTCYDWCPDSVAGNPTGTQDVRKSFVNIDSNGKCSIAQIDKFYLRPAIANTANKCSAFWSIKALNTNTTAVCNIDGTTVPCTNTASGYLIGPGNHTLKTVVTIDQTGTGTNNYTLTDQKQVKCVPNPALKEV